MAHYIKTGSSHLLVSNIAMDSWSGKPKYHAGGNWWYWDSITRRLKRENYQGQKQRRYGSLVETTLAAIRGGQ